MVLILDEAANICRIADLPDLYSHLGSRGMVPVTILQSYQQGVSVWGEPGMASLWGAATRKVIGAGIDDPRLARDLATLVGRHDVPVRSARYGDVRSSEQISLRRQGHPRGRRHPRFASRHGSPARHWRPPRPDPSSPLLHRPRCAPDHCGHGQAEDAMRRGARAMAASPPAHLGATPANATPTTQGRSS